MKTSFTIVRRPLLFGLILLLAGCDKKDDEMPCTSLSGTWKLLSRQCYCAANPSPNETITFTATEFVITKNRVVTTQGSYVATTGVVCGGASAPALRFTYANSSGTSYLVASALSGNTLVLDYGGCVDAPIDTYVRLR